MVNFTVVAGATTGARNISVTTPGGTSTLSDSFIVKQALPIITSVSPGQGSRGETLDVIISGSNLNGVSAISFGSEVAVSSFTSLSPTQVATRITIDRNATAAVRDVSITTTGGTSTFSGSFNVKEEPLGTFFVALIWVGIALVVVLLGFILKILRHEKASSL
jgi:hypothetical protein